MKSTRIAVLLVWLLTCAAGAVFAEQEQDNTGTNPVNFTYDARLIFEMQEFEGGGGSQLITTGEFRWPLGRDIANLRGDEGGSLFYDMGQKYGMRLRARYQTLSLNTGEEPFGSSDVSGIGDFDMRFLALVHGGRKVLVATGLEAFFDTASNDALGSGNTSLGPQIFVGFPGIIGGSSLFIPGYQYVFDVAGEGTVSRSQIDLYFVWILASGKNWLIVNPQGILDHDLSEEFATFETEWGFMIAPSIGSSGYLRPGVGLTNPSLYSWNFEFGFKFVWR